MVYERRKLTVCLPKAWLNFIENSGTHNYFSSTFLGFKNFKGYMFNLSELRPTTKKSFDEPPALDIKVLSFNVKFVT